MKRLFLLLTLLFTALPASAQLGFSAGTLAAPVASPVAGTYTSVQTVTFTDASASNAWICYTIDGSTPTGTASSCGGTGTHYTTGISVSVTTTLKAVAFYPYWRASSVFSGTYTINLSHTWTYEQSNTTACTTSGSPATCNLTALGSAVTAGSTLIIIGTNTSGNNDVISSVSVSVNGAWPTVPSGCVTASGGNVTGYISCAYFNGSASGSLTITVTTNVATQYTFALYEANPSPSSGVTLDGTPANSYTSSATTTPSGIAPTGTSGTSDFCVQSVVSPSGTYSGFQTANSYANGFFFLFKGYGEAVNISPSTVPVWQNGSSATANSSGICFK